MFILYMYISYMDMFTWNMCNKFSNKAKIAYTLYGINFWWWFGFTIRYYALLYKTFICVCNERIKNILHVWHFTNLTLKNFILIVLENYSRWGEARVHVIYLSSTGIGNRRINKYYSVQCVLDLFNKCRYIFILGF